MKPAANLNALWARALIQELVRAGLQEAVSAPGSRSAPLALACAEEPRLSVRSVVDERSAAFLALGAAKATGRPALVLCTSGSAGAHFYPAILEAEASRIPLIAITADRPLELHGFGAPQTMEQHGLFGARVRFFADLGLPEGSEVALLHLRANASLAAARSLGSPRGPVHLNAPFREPLAPEPQPLPAGLSARALEGPAMRVALSAPAQPDGAAVREAAGELSRRSRGVIVCGPRDAADDLPEAVSALSAALGYPVLPEAASGVRYRLLSAITHYDALLRHGGLATALRPDAVVRVGAGLTSKTLQAWLDASGAYTIVLSEEGELVDPSHAGTLALVGHAPASCRALTAQVRQNANSRSTANANPTATTNRTATATATPNTNPTATANTNPTATATPTATANPTPLAAARALRDGFAAEFAAAERRARAALEAAFAREASLSEARTSRDVVAALPEGALLFVSSSMPVRDVDAWASSGAGVRVLANRGLNGIDGIVSTALGSALATRAPTAVLLGDLALLHDLGGLLAARRLGVPLTLVVVNNDGGGIFAFLPIADLTEQFEPLFATPHGLDLAHAAALAGARFQRATTPAELRKAIRESLGGELSIVEVRTDRAANVAAHHALFEAVAQALEESP